jgi:hypothetical protein
MHGSNLGNPHIKIRAYNAWASALTASHHQDDSDLFALTPTVYAPVAV